jgi:hypothetical protein
VAESWDNFKFHAVKFIFSPSLPTTAAGAVYMCIDYDINDPNPTGPQQILAQKTNKRGPVIRKVELSASVQEMESIGPRKFVYKAGTASRVDSAGFMYILVETAMAQGVVAGDLMVEYDVTLYAPQFRPTEAAYIHSKTIEAITPTKANPAATGTSIGGTLSGAAFNAEFGELEVTLGNIGSYSMNLYAEGTDAEVPPVLPTTNSVVTQEEFVGSTTLKRMANYDIQRINNSGNAQGYWNAIGDFALDFNNWTTLTYWIMNIARFVRARRLPTVESSIEQGYVCVEVNGGLVRVRPKNIDLPPHVRAKYEKLLRSADERATPQPFTDVQLWKAQIFATAECRKANQSMKTDQPLIMPVLDGQVVRGTPLHAQLVTAVINS